jgi:hypothetical protein
VAVQAGTRLQLHREREVLEARTLHRVPVEPVHGLRLLLLLLSHRPIVLWKRESINLRDGLR